jgi:hypothetical protein
MKISRDWETKYIQIYKYSEADIKGMLGFLVYNIYVICRNQVFQQSVGNAMGITCAPLLADLLLYSFEEQYVQKLFRENRGKKTSCVL